LRTNAHMRAILEDDARPTYSTRLPDDAQAIVDAGWTLGPSGSLLLAALWGGRREELPSAEVGRYEYEVNDADISLADLIDEEERFLARAASRALHFAGRMMEEAASVPGSETLQASVAIHVDMTDEDFSLQGANVRFFTQRGDPLTWFDDLESFRMQAIAVLDLSDVSRPR
jgi:hypothetical protein